ncbi:hypothetical protein B7L88_gp103 [Rhizobium phage RHEph10]|uniref:hypothetical protein n=1 Tax=Rhizobium phage RHEph10 TaxID=1220717 RepID=UPI0002AB40D8|nr:hypothetical protein B7L88_gp103 [Rhizobium phage RHEph10]AGC36185.1 hypothetical protein RHEph10_gp142 [Rhizobium phage RHEph10]
MFRLPETLYVLFIESERLSTKRQQHGDSHDQEERVHEDTGRQAVQRTAGLHIRRCHEGGERGRRQGVCADDRCRLRRAGAVRDQPQGERLGRHAQGEEAERLSQQAGATLDGARADGAEDHAGVHQRSPGQGGRRRSLQHLRHRQGRRLRPGAQWARQAVERAQRGDRQVDAELRGGRRDLHRRDGDVRSQRQDPQPGSKRQAAAAPQRRQGNSRHPGVVDTERDDGARSDRQQRHQAGSRLRLCRDRAGRRIQGASESRLTLAGQTTDREGKGGARVGCRPFCVRWVSHGEPRRI